MVDKMNMTLFQLRTYKAWLERDRDAFVVEYPKAKKDATNAKMGWYEKELNDVKYWTDVKETKAAREEMEAKAAKFLYPQPVSIIRVGKPRPDWMYRVNEFFSGMFR